ncbi:MAG: lysophospholipid acyltransferase family protein [Devosia sp.]
MRKAWQAVRSALFYALFLGQTAVLAIIIGTIAIIVRGPTRIGWVLARYWGDSTLWLLRWVVGIRSAVEGAHNIPPGGCILAAKHQSDWDIFALLPHTGRPAFVAKKELMNIPFFGWAAMSFDTIRVDRSLGVGAIPAMMADARQAIAKGCRIVIYPEGTRRPPLAAPEYRQGIVKMYLELGVPVVPVALNSGLYWGRNSLILWPGLARASILPPIPPGLDAQVFRQRLIEAIETESDRLALEALDRGMVRPVDAVLAQRAAAARQRGL